MKFLSQARGIVMNLLNLSELPVADGKVNFSTEQMEKMKTELEEFGPGFVDAFIKASNDELKVAQEAANSEAATKAKTEADNSAKKLIETMQEDFSKKMTSMEENLKKEFTQQLESQKQEYEEKMQKMGEKAEELPAGTTAPQAKGKKFAIVGTAKHNVYGAAASKGQMIVNAGDTIDVTELSTEFGAIVTKDADFIKKSIIQPTESIKYMTPVFGDKEYRATHAQITSVVQQFSAAWTPKGKASFKPLKVVNYQHKINVPIVPAEILGSWVGYLYDNELSPEQMPIVKFIVDQLIIPQIESDREMFLFAKGEFQELESPEDGDAGQETGASMDGFITTIYKEYEKGESTTMKFQKLKEIDDDNIVDKMNAFVDGMDPIYRNKGMFNFVADNVFGKYKRRYQELYPTSKGTDATDDKINFSQITLKALPSMAGLGTFFSTPKQNFLWLRNKDTSSTKIWMQTENYTVKIFAEWWEGVGFGIGEAVFAYVNVIDLINRYIKNNDASKLAAFMLVDAGCTSVDATKIAGYRTAILAEDSIADLDALQAIITAVNAA